MAGGCACNPYGCRRGAALKLQAGESRIVLEGTQLLGKAPDTTKPQRDRPPGSRVSKIAAKVVDREFGSSGRTRTYNPPVNSRMLCQLSY